MERKDIFPKRLFFLIMENFDIPYTDRASISLEAPNCSNLQILQIHVIRLLPKERSSPAQHNTNDIEKRVKVRIGMLSRDQGAVTRDKRNVKRDGLD